MTVDLGSPLRAAVVDAYDVIGRPPRPDLVAIADLAAMICAAPMAAVSLLTDSAQHHVATVGLDPVVCGLDESMCAAVIDLPAPVVVPDCREHPLLADNPYVDGRFGDVRFYASWRLVNHDGVLLGTLCVFDTVVRELDPSQVAALDTLAARVVDILDLALRSRELAETLAEVEAVRTELERSNERLASFAGQVSHDLKTPLTSMSLTLSLAREELLDDQPPARSVPLIDRAISGSLRMASLIDDVLSFAMLGELDRVAVDLGEVLGHVRADLWEGLDEVKLTSGELPVVAGDEAQLRALLQNLVDNACKHRRPGRPAEVHVAATRLVDAWRITVTDNGRGVPDHMRERVFEPLARVDDHAPGTGIGLATCRRVVEAHGGRIGLQPAADGGTVAWFELPA